MVRRSCPASRTREGRAGSVITAFAVVCGLGCGIGCGTAVAPPSTSPPAAPRPVVTQSETAPVAAFIEEAPIASRVELPPYEPPPADAAPELGVAAERAIDAAARAAIGRGEVPGAVIAVVIEGELALLRAYGARAVLPRVEPMTVDTIFDLSSVTKPVATAASVFALVDEGKVRLDAPVATYLPDFAAGQTDKEAVTVRELLAHTSGLAAVSHLSEYRAERAQALAAVRSQPLVGEPGARTRYSDLGYIVLGDLVEHVSGERLDAFAARSLFEPLGLTSTSFLPGEELAVRAAPTEKRRGAWLRGRVHDPRAELLGGVAGHAGAFSTAGDLAQFARLLLARGWHDGRALLRPQSVQEILAPAEPGERSLGLSSMLGGVGHTGFTGSFLWLDPARDAAAIVLTSRLHPSRDAGDPAPLRREIVSLVRSVVASRPAPPLRTGIDVLERRGFEPLAGKRVGLVTNHTGHNAGGTRTADLLARSGTVELGAIFSPEHGVGGDQDTAVAGGRDEATGAPVYSLYGTELRPSDAQLAGLDALVFDVQDAGARFYTYITTMGYALEAAARKGIPLVVLDRPNPLGGDVVEGPLSTKTRRSFTSYHEIPVRHGMTTGELAQLFNEERGLGAEVVVVRMKGWRRDLRWDALGRKWPTPSPNLRSGSAAMLYPGVALLETTNVSVGRGTDRPFEHLGAPWIDGDALALAMNDRKLAGVRFTATTFTPRASTFAGERCGGVALEITDAAALRSVQVGLALAVELRRAYPDAFRAAGLGTLLANDEVLAELLRGGDLPDLLARAEEDRADFERRRRRYLLY